MPRIITVSNRLPVKIEEGGIGKSPGGLVSAMEAVAEGRSLCWVGWPGAVAQDAEQESRYRRELREKFNYHPVFLTAEQIEAYYNGFCNASLWPLLHYRPTYGHFDAAQFEAYRQANQMFADAVIDTAEDGDTVWVHDYHLMLVPQMLKQSRPGLKVGFFLHTPFPAYEVFRYHPQREMLLRGLLGADLVGFHTFGYLRHFRNSVSRVLDLESDVTFIDCEEHRTHIGVFPIGINWRSFEQAMSGPAFAAQIEEHHRRFGDKKLVLSVERLDYTKGIPEKLGAIRQYLDGHPQAPAQTVFLIVCVPSRQEVREYRRLERTVEQMVTQINGRYSSLTEAPIHFFHRNVPTEQLAALYSLADVALVTPLIDGMNLVAKEYVACQPVGGGGEPGVLILSEFAGAAQELFNALIVNPYDTDAVAQAIERALDMPHEERLARMAPMRQRVIRRDANDWAGEFLATLDRVTAPAQSPPDPARPLTARVMERFRTTAGRKALLLDYDGTLREFVDQPREAKPTHELLVLLDQLDRAEDKDVVLISGRTPEFLEEHFGSYAFTLVAEHGFRLREPGRPWRLFNPSIDISWKEKVRPLLELYTLTTPGTSIEEKASAIVWHYRQADPEFGARKAAELLGELPEVISNLPVSLMPGKRIVEISSQQINKGIVASALLGRHEYALAMCVGDDMTDEAMFELRSQSVVTIKVGRGPTRAEYRVASPAALRRMLERLTVEEPSSGELQHAGG